MAARTKRAVRVDPGAAADRRETDGKGRFAVGTPRVESGPAGSSAPDSTAPRGTFVEFRLMNPERETSANSSLSGGVAIHSESVELGPWGGRETPLAPYSRARPRRQEPSARASGGDGYSMLYKLEHHRGAFEILFLLLWEGKATSWRMRSVLKPGPQSLQAALVSLIELGLVESIESTREAAFPFGRPYRLSRLGRVLLATPPDHWFMRYQR